MPRARAGSLDAESVVTGINNCGSSVSPLWGGWRDREDGPEEGTALPRNRGALIVSFAEETGGGHAVPPCLARERDLLKICCMAEPLTAPACQAPVKRVEVTATRWRR